MLGILEGGGRAGGTRRSGGAGARRSVVLGTCDGLEAKSRPFEYRAESAVVGIAGAVRCRTVLSPQST